MSMTPAEVKEIVRLTIEELTERKLLKEDSYEYICGFVGELLIKFFNGWSNDISHALRQLSDDPYIDIIYLQYRDSKTLEWIAEYMERDESTIKRNKSA
jgi:hypothetical protein